MEFMQRIFSKLAIIFLISIVLLSVNCQPLKSIEEEMAQVSPEEQKAINELLAESSLTLKDMRPIGVLGVKNNPRAIAFYKGHITGLCITDTKLNKIDALANLPFLEALWLVKNKITNISGLSQSKALTDINLSGNELTSLTGLENATELKTLVATNNKLQSTKGIGGLKKLTNIDLSNNSINQLEDLSGLKDLTNLNLSSNQIKSVAEIKNLESLETLNLDSNNIESFSGLSGLSRLTNLTARKNKISNIEDLLSLVFLKNVDLSENLITQLPKNINKWNLKIEGNNIEIADADTPESPSSPLPKNVVLELPKISGTSKNKTLHFSENLSGFEFSGGFSSINGTSLLEVRRKPDNTTKFYPKANLEVSVATGKVRAFMYYYEGHYLFVDATPNNPAKLKGRLMLQGTFSKFFTICIQSIDGEAKDVNIKITQATS